MMLGRVEAQGNLKHTLTNELRNSKATKTFFTMKKLDSNNNNNNATQTANTARRSSTARRTASTTTTQTANAATQTASTARRRSTTARRSATTRRASASKKGSGYNKYVPVFIDNYAEQRSAKLRAKLGWQAYGIYLAILQRLRSEKDCTLELDYESLALSFWTDEDNLRAIIEDFNLFAINRQEGTFYSPLLDSMLSTLDPSLAQSRPPLCPDPVEEDDAAFAEDECEMTEEDVCEMTEENNDFSDNNIEDSVGECDSSVNGCDFSDENSSVSDEKLDVTEKEFLVNEKEIEVFAPFFSEETATRRVADEVSIFASEETQKRIPQDAEIDAAFDAKHTQLDAPFETQNDAEIVAQNDAEFDAKNSVKSDAKSVLQMCTKVVQNDALQSDANEHFSTVSHARVNKQTNTRTHKQPTFGGIDESRRKLLLSPPSTAPKSKGEEKGKKRRPVYLDPPTVEEVAAYAQSLGYAAFEAERFVAYYAANGWKTSRHDMVSWQAAVCNWQKNECRFAQEREQREQQQQQWQAQREAQAQQWQEQREARAQQWQAEREARFAAEQEWRKQHFLAKNGLQEEQDALFQQQRRNYLEQKVVEAVTSDEDKYALPPTVPF